MKTMLKRAPMLREGERMLREDFMDRWEALPDLKFAELIGGSVYLRLFPLSLEHGSGGGNVAMWLGNYAAATPGCALGGDSTWYIRDDAPQPDSSLRILPEYGGQSSSFVRNGKRFGIGAPELVVEVSLSTRTYDLSVKKELYRKARVLEFICVQPEEKKVIWYKLDGDAFVELKAKSGVFRSSVFPGLWLNEKALLAGDSAGILKTVNTGLASAAHARFKAALAARKKK